MVLNKLSAILILLYFSTAVSAQKKHVWQDSIPTEVLEEVIVSATRTQRQLSSLPLPVQLIAKREIQNSNSLRLSDILSEQTGLITIPDFGGGEGIQMQGMDSQYTLILVDGVPLIGRSAGTLDVSRITIGNIAQIEIVKGASSSLYGNEALGGVINIITENPKDGIHSTLQHRYGSFNTNDSGINIGYKRNKLGLSVFMNRLGSGGYDLTDSDQLQTVEPYENYTFNAKLTYDFTENTDLFISGRVYTQQQDYKASELLQGESEINEWNTHIKLNHSFNEKWNSHLEFYASRYKTHEFLNNPDATLFSTSKFNQLLWRPELRTTYRPQKKMTFIGGLGLTAESLSRTDFTTTPKFTSPYVYLQCDAHPTERMNLIIGARYDHHNIYASQFSPKAALRYRLNDKLTLKGSAGYGFKAPDFRQLYFNFSNATVGYTVLGYNAVATEIPRLEAEGQINTMIVPISEFDNELNAENSLSINIGASYRPRPELSLAINFFRNNIDDLIDTRVIANKTNGQNIFSYYNVHEVYTQGLEFNAIWKPYKDVKLSGGYQLLYAIDKKALKDFEDGRVFARESPSSPAFQLTKDDYFGLYNRSRHMANLKLFYDIPKWGMETNIRSTYRSKYGISDTNGNNHLDTYDTLIKGYAIVDIALNKTFYTNYKIGLGIDNVLGFVDAQNISNIPGRIIYGKLTIHI